MTPTIFTITGPTCSGKSTLERKLREHGFVPLRSFTTRPMREGEVDGVDYEFITREQALRLIQDNQVVEYVEFAGNIYGMLRGHVLDMAGYNKPMVVVVEPHGAEQFKKFARAHGWTIHCLYLHVDKSVVIERFLSRLKGDERASVTNYARRLAQLLDVELEWGITHLPLWDTVIPGFGPDNEAQVISQVLELAA
jgi:guanylate kinase